MNRFLENIASELALSPSIYREQAFLANMHALPSVAGLFSLLLRVGVPAENVLFIGKPYSTIPGAQQELVEQGIRFATAPSSFLSGTLIAEHEAMLKKEVPAFIAGKNVQKWIVLDSGGQLTGLVDALKMGIERVSVQLTSSGSRKFGSDTPGVIDIGSHPLKKETESARIGRLIVQSIELGYHLNKKKIGVVGRGAIGVGVAQALAEKGMQSDHLSGLEEERVQNGGWDVLIGATGYDLSDWIEKWISKNHSLALFSCSSWDIEFGRLLAEAKTAVDLAAENGAAVPLRNSSWIVHNGGCPINFNRRVELSAEDGGRAMAMTRGLTLAAALQPDADAFAQNASRVGELYAHYFQKI